MALSLCQPMAYPKLVLRYKSLLCNQNSHNRILDLWNFFSLKFSPSLTNSNSLRTDAVYFTSEVVHVYWIRLYLNLPNIFLSSLELAASTTDVSKAKGRSATVKFHIYKLWSSMSCHNQ